MSAPVELRFIRNFVVEPIAYWIDRELDGSGLSVRCRFGDYAGAADEIASLDPGGGDVLVVALGLEMSSPDFGHAAWPAAAACERHLALLHGAMARWPGPVVLNTVLPAPHDPRGGALPAEAADDEHVEALNLAIRRLAREHAGRARLCDWGRIARRLGAARTYDQRYWRSSAAPFAPRFLAAWASDIAAMVRLRAGRIRKCLVLDADDTLWGGVVGEDGVAGIALSDDTLPGAYFRDFQRSVLDLHARGILLALCSKNDEADVFEVLDRHPDCLLRREHLAAWRIDWNDKAGSIASIAAELGIGIDALVFVDDNPRECAMVSQALPGLRVLQAPADPAERVGFLELANPFEALQITREDQGRNASYRADRERRRAMASPGPDSAAAKQALGTRVRVAPARDVDVPRIAQLLARTNQFNLTTRRHPAERVQAWLTGADALVACAWLEDRFGDLGLVGVAVVLPGSARVHVDTFLLSCRALGRDAELAFAQGVFELAAARWPGLDLTAEYVPTARNSQVEDFWQRTGMRPSPTDAQGRLFEALSGARATVCPPHVELIVEGK